MQSRLVKAKESEDEDLNVVMGCTLGVSIEKRNNVLTVAIL